MTDDWRDARTMGVGDDEIIHLTNIERERTQTEDDLRRLWNAVENCECPRWAVGNREDVEASLERVARLALQPDRRDRNGAEDASSGEVFSDAGEGL